MTAITSRLGADDITLQSCSDCGYRTWSRGEEEMDLREVLDLTARTHRRSSPRQA